MAKIIESSARTTNGNSGDLLRVYGGESVRAQLNVTGASGTSPTLNVLIEDTLDGTNYNTIGSFTQKTSAAREIINITAPFAETLRVSWTIAGTNPSFTFSIDWHISTRRSN
jgi:hypothetical protein